ncbi:MAG: amylo-alpha-1,6-glucosidase [Phycisphaerales bacterium]
MNSISPIVEPKPMTATTARPEATLYADVSSTDALGATEWLLTDGLGGFSMLTALGAATRRYHALYVASTRPPLLRLAVLHNLVDELVLDPDGATPTRIPLASFRFGEHLIHPDGHLHLESFERFDPVAPKSAPGVRWTFRHAEITVTREVSVLHGRGGVCVRYRVAGLSVGMRARLHVRPLVSLRDAHSLLREGASFEVRSTSSSGVSVSRDGHTFHMAATGARFTPGGDWWRNFSYDHDRARGYDHTEDLFCPGVFTADVSGGSRAREVTLVGSLDPEALALPKRDPRVAILRKSADALAKATARRDGVPALLAQAADDFVVTRTIDGVARRSIIAGYPWFADWGRDALIALPGLLLCTGRFGEARDVLLAFAAHMRKGLIPNCFDDRTGEAQFNAADASFWYLRAATDLARVSGKPLPAQIRDACLDIIGHVRAGTDFNIGVDQRDSLVFAGDHTTQLTWMDAKRDGHAFTPRHGKPVEINALWAHSLTALAPMLPRSFASTATELRVLAAGAGESMRRLFWRPSINCLADTLRPDVSASPTRWEPVDEIRPNQVIGAALEHSPFTLEQRRAVVRVAREKLLTPMGMRTLAPGSAQYRSHYRGTMWERDAAYHNGTAWPWLIGFFVEASLRVDGFSASARAQAMHDLAPLLEQLTRGCLGQIPEIADAEAPFAPDGCPAQAWSVAEMIRALCLVGAKG